MNITERTITIPETEKAFPYDVYSTSGNTTALIDVGDEFSELLQQTALRGQIGRTLMTQSPYIEQVGFVERSGKTIKLVMSNDEKCGGAIVAAGYDITQGKPSTAFVQVFIEGKDSTIKVSINKDGQTWVELPIENTPNMLTQNGFGTMVDLGGIIHYVVRTSEPLYTKSSAKAKAKYILNNSSIKTCKTGAYGVMFVREIDDLLNMQPVVLVPGVSFNLEQSCSTGAIAVALSENYASPMRSSKQIIMQPSGETLSTFIMETTQGYKAFISGAVRKIN